MGIESTENHINLPNPRAAFHPQPHLKTAKLSPERSLLLARAFELGIPKLQSLSDQELERAIQTAEESLGRLLL